MMDVLLVEVTNGRDREKDIAELKLHFTVQKFTYAKREREKEGSFCMLEEGLM